MVDYKLPSSGEQDKMNLKVFEDLRPSDFVKFVVKDRVDFDEALKIKNNLNSIGRCQAKFAFSPIYGLMDANVLIEWLMREGVNDAILNVQLHKLLNLKEAM